MSEQIPLDLPVATSRRRGDFFVSESNRLAHALAMAPRDWPGGRLVLVGPAGAGKTHLAGIAAEAQGARMLTAQALAGLDLDALAQGPVVLDDADGVAGERALETKLFHLYNLMQARRHRLLLTARHAPSRWGLGLPDLASRLESVPLARLEPPDDALLRAVLVKLFGDRQLAVNARLVDYLMARMDRSLEAAGDLVARLDRAALAEKRPVTRDLARRVMAGA